MPRLLALLIPCLLLILGAGGAPHRNTPKDSLRSSLQTQLRTDLTMAAGFGGASVFLIIFDDFGRGYAPLYWSPDPAWPEKTKNGYSSATPGDYCHSGCPEIEMPEFDALAAQGRMFWRVTTEKLCTPTKMQILTGQGSWENGITEVGGQGLLLEGYPHLAGEVPGDASGFGKSGAKMSKEIGATGEIGAEQLRLTGWDYWRGQASNTMTNYGHYIMASLVDGVASIVAATGSSPNGSDQHSTDRIADDVAARMPGVGQTFQWIHFHDTHSATHYCDIDVDGECVDAVSSTSRPWDGTNNLGLFGTDDLEIRAISSQVEHVDAALGRILDNIDLTKDYVIVTGDDGSTLPDGLTNAEWGWFSGWDDGTKGSLQDAGSYVPMIVAGPGILQGQTDILASHSDLYHTILAMFGLTPDAADSNGTTIRYAGINLLPFLKGQADAPARRFVQVGASYIAGEDQNEASPGSTNANAFQAIRDARIDFAMLWKADDGTTGTLYEMPMWQWTAQEITSGDDYDYLNELFTTQSRNIEEATQSWCYDGSGDRPPAHVCEDFEPTLYSVDSTSTGALASSIGTQTVVVGHQNHGKSNGDDVTISGQVTASDNGFSPDDINGDFTVASASTDSYEVTASGGSATTTRFGDPTIRVQYAPSTCIIDTTADDHLVTDVGDCAVTSGALAGTQMLVTGAGEWLAWDDLSPDPPQLNHGCSDTAVCTADFLMQHDNSGSTTEPGDFGFYDDLFAELCVLTVNQATGDVTLDARPAAGAEQTVADVFPDSPAGNVTRKVRLQWDATDATTHYCRVWFDSESGTYGEGAIAEGEISRAHDDSAQNYIESFWFSPLGKWDNLVITSNEVLSPGSWDRHIDGFGWYAIDFEQALDSDEWTAAESPLSGEFDPTLLMAAGGGPSRVLFTNKTDNPVSGNVAFDAGTVAFPYSTVTAQFDAAGCNDTDGKTCIVQWDMNLYSHTPSAAADFGVAMYDAASVAHKIFSFTTTGVSAGQVQMTSDDFASSPAVTLDIPGLYRFKVHVEQDGSDDVLRWWIHKLDDDAKMLRLMADGLAEANVDPATEFDSDLWFQGHPDLGGSIDNVRARMIDNQEL